MKRKQSLTLNLKRSLPASSSGRSSSSSDIYSSHDLKSFQDACNRKLRIASALCLLPSDLASSTDTSETFHTAAADSPELRSFFPDINIAEMIDIKSNKIVDENINKEKENNDELNNQTAEKTEVKNSLLSSISLNYSVNSTEVTPNSRECKEEKEDKDEEVVIEKKIDDKILEKHIISNLNEDNDKFMTDDNIESQEVANIDKRIQENKEMKRLNEMVNQQRMVVMKCLETSSPAKDEVNRQILILQDLQRQQIELEVWLLKREKQFKLGKGVSQISMMKPPIDYVETESEDDSNWNLPSGSNQQESDRDTMSDRVDEPPSRSITPGVPTTRGYSSVYLRVSIIIL